ncbi:hypothetical protein [Nocardia wallacei]|uniref:hypothetical protein n=1 Tax=Nocardia wallacei TaxID=480035 RepID=UPI002454B413|nr:hypothetical protein [Nocardia wallacei]
MTYPNFGIPDMSQIPAAMGRTLTSWIAGENIPDATSPSDVQDRYNRQRDSVRGAASQIGFEGAFRPRSVNSTDNFEQHDLATLRGKVDKIDLNAVGDLIEGWRQIGVRDTTSLQTFQQAMTKATSEDIWRGETRNAAAQAVTDYTTQASQVSRAATLTGNKLSELRTGLEPTKDLVPHVPEHRSGVSNFRHFVAGRGWKNDDSAYANAYSEAKRVLSTVYAPVVHESDTNVPVIPKPNEQKPVPPGGDQPPVTPGGNTGGPTQSGGTDGTGATTDPTQQDAGTQDPNAQGSQSNSGDTGRSTGSENSGDSTRTDPSSATTSSGVDPNASQSSGGSGPRGLGGGGGVGGGAGGGGGGLGGGTAGPGGQGGVGTSVPLAAQPGAAGGAGRAAASAGRAGASGMPGMAPGAAGRGQGDKDEERTKTTPDYLITQEHGDELTGIPDLPKTVPPVLGE